MEIRPLLGGVLLALGASAASPPASSPADLPRLVCRSFPTEPGATVDTRDPSTPLGGWILDQEDAGWRVSQVDWEITQKPTGYPQAYTHVCLTTR